ncbi:cytochrome c [Devosia sp.]|uniref:c-type cytochrome n=1 Tax=Devosia sp. TaxID=1871048 RepID=UPI0019DC7654|nr:cytochrome c [Devosia sp.]MBE0579559.1 cytochrome c [Devosia sp.]
MKLTHLLIHLGLALLIAAPVTADEVSEQLFVDACSGCHQLGGVGQPALAPPLVDPALWAGLGEQAPDYLVGVIVGGLTGKITVAGQDYIGLAMPPQDWMTDEEIAAVAAYVLNDLNGLDLTATPELIAAIRPAHPSHQDLRAIRKEAWQ